MDLGTPAATRLVGTLALLVVAGLGWTVVVGPETSTLADTRAEIESTRDQNSLLTVQLASLEKQVAQLGDTRRTARDLSALFPPTADQPGLFEEVTAAAVDAGIGPQGVTSLAPSPPVIGGAAPGAPEADPATPAAPTGGVQLARQTVSVSVSGTYDQTQRLLANLEQMSRAYLVRSVTLAGDASTGAYTTTIDGDMFVMPPVTDPGEAVNLAATTQD
jgi:Tfp pilus assembly protein PilO